MDYPYLNCWGLVRHARHELYDLPLLPAYTINARDKVMQTSAALSLIHDQLIERQPSVGDIAAVWRGRLCVHVALVVEVEARLAILEADEGINCRWRRLRDWERLQTRVTYYGDNQRIPINAAR